MEKCFDENKVAKLTGTAIQDDETFKTEGGFIPERDHVFMVGFKDLLICLRLLEEMGEIPKINGKWWTQIETLYGGELCMVKYKETK